MTALRTPRTHVDQEVQIPSRYRTHRQPTNNVVLTTKDVLESTTLTLNVETEFDVPNDGPTKSPPSGLGGRRMTRSTVSGRWYEAISDGLEMTRKTTTPGEAGSYSYSGPCGVQELQGDGQGPGQEPHKVEARRRSHEGDGRPLRHTIIIIVIIRSPLAKWTLSEPWTDRQGSEEPEGGGSSGIDASGGGHREDPREVVEVSDWGLQQDVPQEGRRRATLADDGEAQRQGGRLWLRRAVFEARCAEAASTFV